MVEEGAPLRLTTTHCSSQTGRVTAVPLRFLGRPGPQASSQAGGMGSTPNVPAASARRGSRDPEMECPRQHSRPSAQGSRPAWGPRLAKTGAFEQAIHPPFHPRAASFAISVRKVSYLQVVVTSFAPETLHGSRARCRRMTCWSRRNAVHQDAASGGHWTVLTR